MTAKNRMSLREWLPLIGITCAAFVFNTSEFMPVALLTSIASDFSVSEAQAGMLISVYAWAVMLLSLPLMILASRVAFRTLLLVVVALFALFQVASAVAPGYWTLMAARLGVAAAHAVFWSIAAPIAIRVVSEEHRPFAMSVIVMGSSVATIAGLPLGRMIGLAVGWRMTFCCVAIISVLILLYMMKVFPQVEAAKPFSVRELPSLIATPALRGIYLFTAIMMTGFYAAYSYIEPFLQQVIGLEGGTVTLVLSLFGAAGVLGSMAFSRLYGRLHLRFLGACIAGVVAVLFALWAAAGMTGGSASASAGMGAGAGAFVYAGALAIAACGCWGLFGTALNVALQAEVIKHSSLDAQAVATSIYSGIYNFGIGCGTLAGGFVVTHAGIANVGLAGGVIAVAALVYFAFVLNRHLRVR